MRIKIDRTRFYREERMLALATELRVHYANLTRLYAFACGKRTLKYKGYSDEAEQYRRTQADWQRLPWTVRNLKQQIARIEDELDALLQHNI